VAALLSALQTTAAPLLRDEILVSLARRAPPQAAAPLAKRLTVEDGALPALTMALAAIATPPALQALVDALARPQSALVAERALARAGAKAIVPLSAALTGPAAVRAARLLGEIGDRASARSAGALVRALGAADPALRAAAAQALGRMGVRAVAAALLRLLRDPATEVVQAALVGLAQLGAPAHAPALAAYLARAPQSQRPAALRALAAADPALAVQPLARALRGADTRLREAALQVIEGERPSAHWLPLLEQRFASDLRESTASALARVPEGAGVVALLRVGRRSPESAERAARALAIALRAAGDDLPDEQREQAHALIQSLPPERRVLLSALARSDDALRAIGSGLAARSANARATAAAAATLLGDAEAGPALLSALARERDPEAARRLASAALELRVRTPSSLLWRLFADAETAPEAMLLAAASADRAAPPDRDLRVYLRRTLSSRKPARVRASAALALGALGDSAALTPLQAALSDPSTRVRLAAVRALGALGGADAARACRLHARIERDMLVRGAALAVADRDGRAVELAERGELVLEARVIGLDPDARERPLIDVLLADGRWLRMRADAQGELIVAGLPAGTAELRRVE
jgi:HEAT repeat protein